MGGLKGVQPGDELIVSDPRSPRRRPNRATVASVGRTWVTARGGLRYRIDDGRDECGATVAEVPADYEERMACHALREDLREAGILTGGAELSRPQLEAILAIVKEGAR
jgi:hypothetical protein